MNCRTIGIVVIILVVLSSCGEKKKMPHSGSTRTLINAVITDSIGRDLELTFDNEQSTCFMRFNGDTATLHQERTASGIRYSNARYVYSEWHGESMLELNGAAIFKHNQSAP